MKKFKMSLSTMKGEDEHYICEDFNVKDLKGLIEFTQARVKDYCRELYKKD